MRRLVVLGSVSGAPGVTTTALAMAAAWPAEVDGGVRPVVVEADGSGGDLMIRFGLPTAPSLLDVAAAVGRPVPGSLLGAASELPCGVRAVVAVPGRASCSEAVRLLVSEAGQRVLLGDRCDNGTVLVDAGRLVDGAWPLLGMAGEVLLVTRGGAEPLTHVSGFGFDEGLRASRVTLVVVGPCPYAETEIVRTLGVRRVCFLPWDARSVAALNGLGRRALRTSGVRVPPLMAAARNLGLQLHQAPSRDIEEEASVLGGDDVGLPRMAGRTETGIRSPRGAGNG